jgi:hypothetical protein
MKPRLNHVVACDFLMQENMSTSQHLTLQTGGNKGRNKGIKHSVYSILIVESTLLFHQSIDE